MQGSAGRRAAEFWGLAQRVAQTGTRGSGRLAFLRDVSEQLLAFAHCTTAEWWMTDVDDDYYWCTQTIPSAATTFEYIPNASSPGNSSAGGRPLGNQILSLMAQINRGVSQPRSFLVHDTPTHEMLKNEIDPSTSFSRLLNAPHESTIILLLLRDDARFIGLLALTVHGRGAIPREEIPLYEQLAEGIGRAVINRRAQFRLRERIKELTCLHRIAQVAQSMSDTPETALRAIVEQLPPAMQFPQIADARLTLDHRDYGTRVVIQCIHRLRVPIVIAGQERGAIEVSYRESHPEFAAGAFLREETDLMNSVAYEIAMLIERSEAAAAKTQLAEQLRHAERLATIGQLAAGIAHELNEPLGNIIGFAQLMAKQPGLPETALRDAGQIVKAGMYGREIVKKLLLFARQSDAQRIRLDLGNLVRDGLCFLEARCRNGGIDLRIELESSPTYIIAVPSEMTQVLVNLVVNAIQAMPTGGVLTIRTRIDGACVVFSVQDTGEGMDEGTRQRLFTPFFTTKDIGEGTGLGLAVVHGIVSSHGGTIHVDTARGRGSQFEIRLPTAEAAEPLS